MNDRIKIENLQQQCAEFKQHRVAANMEIDRLRRIIQDIAYHTTELRVTNLCKEALAPPKD